MPEDTTHFLTVQGRESGPRTLKAEIKIRNVKPKETDGTKKQTKLQMDPDGTNDGQPE
jgi:hypothetical protein